VDVSIFYLLFLDIWDLKIYASTVFIVVRKSYFIEQMLFIPLYPIYKYKIKKICIYIKFYYYIYQNIKYESMK